MVTGASTADLALVLIDARKGVLEQSRRHAFLASLLGIPHLVVCVNKMDLVDWSQERFDEIKAEFRSFAMKLDVHDLTFIPVSALHGDNVVERSANMPWYEGTSLLHHLEEVHIASDRNLIDARFPVQYVIRPQDQVNHDLHDYRGYAGTVAGGVFKPGDEVVVLPSGLTTTIAAIDSADGAGRRGVRPHGGHDPAGRRRRRVPGRHDLPGPQPPPRRPGHRGDGVLADAEGRPARRAPSSPSSTPPAGAGRWSRTCSTGSTSTRCTATSTPTRWRSTRSGGCSCARPCRCSSTSTAATAATGSFILVDEATNNTVGAGIILGPTEADA